MKEYTVNVRYTGRIEYIIKAESEAEALRVAEELAEEEDRLGALEDIEWDSTVIA